MTPPADGQVVSLFPEGRQSSLFPTRMPPSNMPAEQALLGAIMATEKAFAAVEGFLKPEHFVDPVHGHVFGALARRIRAGQLADVVILRSDLDEGGILSTVGGLPYLAQLQAAMVSPRSAGEYGRVIREAWERRQMIEAAEALIDRAHGEGDPALVRGELRQALDVLDEDKLGSRDRPVSLLEAMDRALAAADKAAQGGGVVGVSTGMPTIDAVLGGLEAGSLTVLGGRPGSGKSALGHQWALAAARAGVPVAEFSLEMSAASLGRRALSIASGVPIWRMRRGEHAEVAERLVLARREMANLPIEIHDGMRFSASEIAVRCRAQARKRGLGLILVDHLHLVPAEGGGNDSATAQVTAVVDALLGVAKSTGVPMLLLAQLNRGVENRDDHRPSLRDLRQSGAIEQNADAVAFVHRPELHISKAAPVRGEGEPEARYAQKLADYEDQRARLAGVAEVICDKVRDGEPGVVPMRFDGATASFREIGP